MVSTRGSRSKFSVGEKVLCYEPDPTKARVLYDSKVLQVIVKTDKGGRRAVEYLIHFQGWNSSWDRYVSEDFVLKHTDENWKLQRKLAEKAQLRPAAYLYRRDRKEQKQNKLSCKRDNSIEQKDIQHITAPSKASQDESISSHSNRSVEIDDNEDHKACIAGKGEMGDENIMDDKLLHHACSDEGDTHAENSGDSADGHNNNDNGFGESVDKGGDDIIRSNGCESDNYHNQDNADDGVVGNNTQPNECETNDDITQSAEGALEYLEENNVTLEITDVMKEILELDNELIKSRNKVVRLPASPNVVTILELYVRQYAINQICGTPEKPRRKYRRHQNHQNNSVDIDRINRSVNICKEVADGVRIYFDFTLSGLLLYNEERDQYEQSRNMTVTKEQVSRLCAAAERKDEENVKFHPADDILSCEPSTSQGRKITCDGKTGTSSVKKHSRVHHIVKSKTKRCTSSLSLTDSCGKETEVPYMIGTDVTTKGTCLLPVTSKEETTSTFHDNISSIASISSKYTPRSVISNTSSLEEVLSARGCPRSSSDFHLPHLLDWQLVPDSLYAERPVLPSLVYGAVHLARLFVKLPGLLLNTAMPAKKLKIVLRHLQMILRYLEQNKDWYGENVYQDSNPVQERND